MSIFPEASAELRKIKEDVKLKIAEKQDLCCRLYFLSDAEILDLLSAVTASRDIEIWRLFPGLEALDMTEGKVTGVTRLGNPYKLQKPIRIGQATHIRSIEEWTGDLDHSVKEMHRNHISSVLTQYTQTGPVWSAHKDNEAVLIAYYVWITQNLQEILQEKQARPKMQELLKTLGELLEEGISRFQPSQPESPMDKFSNFVIPDEEQHSKLMNNTNLAHCILAHIEFIQRLLESQDMDLAIQWKTAIKLKVTPGDNFSLVMDCFDLTSVFGFETHSSDYLQSLVLTPMSERHSWHVYLTLKHGQGCMLLGDSLHDQTETIKLLAVACGRVYYSVPLTTCTQFDVMVKFMVGCVSGGFWGCFEEIHTVETIHLTTLAKYVAVAMAATTPARIIIDGFHVKPKPGYAFFCTSKPASYPTTVSSTFRNIAVAKPDLSISASILLEIHGIPQSRKYGHMMAEAMEALAQPMLVLSTGGMLHLHLKPNTRTLLRLIRAMASMDKGHYGLDLDYLLNNAFRQVYGLGQPMKELSALDECLATLFHAAHNEKLSRVSTKNPTVDAISKLVIGEGMPRPEVLIKRCQQIFTLITTADWPWVFVAGQANSGKSSAITLAAKAVAVASGIGFQVHRLGPVISNAALVELYTQLHLSNRTWSAVTQRTKAVPVGENPQPFSSRDWIHVDSSNLPYTSELMFALTKNYPHSTVKMLIETESLAEMDPGLAAEGGLLYVEKDEIDVYDYYLTIMAPTCEATVCIDFTCGKDKTALMPSIERLYSVLFEPSYAYFSTAEKTMKVDVKLLIEMFSRLLKPFLTLIRKKEKIEESKRSLLEASKNLALAGRSLTFAPLVAKQLLEESRKDTILSRSPIPRQSTILQDIATARRQKKIKPKMTLEAVYLVSLLNVISNFVTQPEIYCKIIMDILKEQKEEFAGFVLREYDSLKATSLLEMTFSIKQMNWTLLLSMFTAKPQGIGKLSSRSLLPDTNPLEQYENSAFSAKLKDEIIVPSVTTQRLSYWVEFCLRNRIDIVVFGPHQSGKTAITMGVAKELLGGGFMGLISLNVSSHMTKTAVQELVEASMERRRQRDFGGVGGCNYFAVLDDMNLDASEELYDLWRFWRETGGWYSRGFTTLSDLTLALVHSYVEGKSRPILLRAFRHFVALHKPSYSQQELGSIFRQYIYYSIAEEVDQEGMLSVAEESVRSLVSLYSQLSVLPTEQIWAQLAIGNFTQGLRFVAQFEVNEDMDIPQYLRIWTFMFSRFFFDQSSSADTNIRKLLTSNLQTLIDRFTDSDAEAAGIIRSAVLIPAAKEVDENEPRPFNGFEYLREDTIPLLIHFFRESRSAAAQKYPLRFKHLHSLLFDVEERLSAYMSFYLSALYDINGNCQSLVVHTTTQVEVIRALSYMAAETLRAKVFEFNTEENDDVLAGTLIDNFSSFSQNYFPTTPRYEIKRIMEETMLRNHKVTIIMTLQGEGQFNRLLTRRYMEIALNIITGVKLNLAGFASYYREFVDKYRDANRGSKMYNDEIVQVLLSRMKANTTFVFIIAASEDNWQRSPLHPVGLLELFKHEYRTIFNRSRIVAFDTLRANNRLVQLVTLDEELLEEWRLDFSTDILREAGESLQSLDLGIICDEYVYECVSHCAKTLLSDGSARRTARKESLQQAVDRINSIQTEIRQIDDRIATFRANLESVEKTLQDCQSQFSESELYLSQALSHPYETEFRSELEQRRTAQQTVFMQGKEIWESAVDSGCQGLEDLSDLDKIVANPAAVRVAYLLFALVNQAKGEVSPTDKIENSTKKWLIQAGKKSKETARKLKAISYDAMPNFGELLSSYEAATQQFHSIRLFQSIYSLLTASITFKNVYIQWNEVSQSLAREEAEIPAKVAEIYGKFSEEEQEVQTSLKFHMAEQEALAKTLRQRINYVRDKKNDLFDLSKNLEVVKEVWQDALETYLEDDQYAVSESILAGFYMITGLKHSANQRKSVWNCVSKVLDKRGFDCQDVESLTPRLMSDFPTFALDCVKFELANSEFFYESAAYLRLVLDLKLPFPLIYDPFDVAFQYLSRLEESKGALIGRVTSDGEFERRLRECIVEGKPVVCHNPSLSLYRALYPAIVWRSQCFLLSLRGLETNNCTLKIQQKPTVVHPNFRLYICHTEPPPLTIKHQMTELSFEAEDKESWEGLLVSPLLKVLDSQQLKDYINLELQTAQNKLNLRDEENAMIQEILKQHPENILTSEDMEKTLSIKCTKMHFGGKGMARRVSTFYLANDSSLISEEILEGPREKLLPLLSELYRFRTVLYTLNPELDYFAISGKTLLHVIVRALKEHGKALVIPPVTLWEGLTESLIYNVFIRVFHSLSREKRYLFACFYALYRVYKQGNVRKEEYFQALEDIIHLSGNKMDTNMAFSHLQGKYPGLFPSHFSPGSAIFKSFLEKDTYKDAELPGNLSCLHKFMLYSYLRPDLLPFYAVEIMKDALGSRYTWVPDYDLGLLSIDIAKSPYVLLYEDNSPIETLQNLAKEKQVQLVCTQPLFPAVARVTKMDMRGIGRYSDPIFSEINSRIGTNTWIVIENLSEISGLESEILTKFLLSKSVENTCEGFRLFILLPGSPKSYPQWSKLIVDSTRVVVCEPQCIKDMLMEWYQVGDPVFHERQQDYLQRTFWSKCAINPTSAVKSELKLKTSFRSALVEEGEVRASGSDDSPLNPYTAFASALFCAVLTLRNRYNTEITHGMWSLQDAKRSMNDFLLCLPAGSDVNQVLRAVNLSLCCSLLAPQMNQYATGAFLTLLQQVFAEGKTAVTIRSRELVARLNRIEYPLYTEESDDRTLNIHVILTRYPTEDHLYVTGLSHSIVNTAAREMTRVMLPAISTLPLAITEKGYVSSLAKAALKANEKTQLVDTLQSALSGLISALPEPGSLPDPQFSTTRNYIFKKRASWLSKAPSKPKDPRTQDLRNSILDEPQQLTETWSGIKRAEEHMRTAFLQKVRKPLVEMMRFLMYARSTLSREHWKLLENLANGKIPDKWFLISPQIAKNQDNFEKWKNSVIACFKQTLEGETITFSALFSPLLALQTILRAFSLHLLKKKEDILSNPPPEYTPGVSSPDVSPRRTPKISKFYQLGFLLSLQSGASRFEIGVQGMVLSGGKLDTDSGFLGGWDGDWELPTVYFCPMEVPKEIRNNPVYPAGLKLIVRGRGQMMGEWETGREATVLLFQRPAYPEPRHRPIIPAAYIYCPLELSADTATWLLIGSKESQGYWSKRGIKATLKV